jgi:hypothetical protein
MLAAAVYACATLTVRGHSSYISNGHDDVVNCFATIAIVHFLMGTGGADICYTQNLFALYSTQKKHKKLRNKSNTSALFLQICLR